jgi:hypothetical protein
VSFHYSYFLIFFLLLPYCRTPAPQRAKFRLEIGNALNFLRKLGYYLYTVRTLRPKPKASFPFYAGCMRCTCDRRSPSEAWLGSRCDARSRGLVSASQQESILARSHGTVLQDRNIVVLTFLQRRRHVVADLGRSDKSECVLKEVSRGRRDIVTRRTVEKLNVCLEMKSQENWRGIPERTCPTQEPSAPDYTTSCLSD